jgi:hypothetical protein
MKPYFYVYRENVGQGPTIRHATLELAQAEAERLAVKHTGSVIQILKCVGFAQVTGPASTFFMDGEVPVHPCEARVPKVFRDAPCPHCSGTGNDGSWLTPDSALPNQH